MRWSFCRRSSTRFFAGKSSRTCVSRTKLRHCPQTSLSNTSFARLKVSTKSSMPGPDTELTPASAASIALVMVGARLRVEELPVRKRHVGLGRKSQGLGDGDVTHV